MVGSVSERQIRILIADDHEMTREGWAMILSKQPGVSIVAQARNGEEAIAAYALHTPDVALLDLQMPVVDGVTATTEIVQRHPSARVILFTTFDGDEDIFRGLQAGARGYILKDSSAADVVRAVQEVAAGRRFMPPIVGERLAQRLESPPLSGREIEVLAQLAEGLSNKEIGFRLGISEGTVKAHVNAVLVKLDAASRADAVLIAHRRGILRRAYLASR